jgi:hypothetical protein
VVTWKLEQEKSNKKRTLEGIALPNPPLHIPDLSRIHASVIHPFWLSLCRFCCWFALVVFDHAGSLSTTQLEARTPKHQRLGELGGAPAE